MSEKSQHTTRIIIERQGPMTIKGKMELRDADGCLIETSGEVRLCRCGNSRKKPFCDKTHQWRDWMDGLQFLT